MSLLCFPLRPAASIGSQCLRCFTTTTSHAQQTQSSSQGILDILAERPTNASSFRNAAGSSSSSTALRFARAAGMDRPQEQTREFVEAERRVAFQRQIFRRYQPGDVYSPHDLSGAEQKKWKTGRKKPTQDAFDVLGINPVNEYKNFTVMSEYMTEMGRIKHSRDTGLRPKNQRKIAKAIRRAIGLGLMPSVHRHPLVVKNSHPSRFQ